MQLFPKKRIACGVLLLSIIALLLVWVTVKASPRFRLLDPTFKVVDVRLSTGRTLAVYCGGLTGRLVQKIHDFGIPIPLFGGLEVDFGQEALGLAMIYAGNLSLAEANSVEAILIHPDGRVTVAQTWAGFLNPLRGEYGRAWMLDPAPPPGTVLQVRAGTNRPLVEIPLHK